MSVYWIKYRGTRFPVRRGETILGRSPYSSIVISNSLVSREHCALRLAQGGLQIIDLGSTNGTTVNDEKVTGAQKLEPGDIIGVGTDVLEVCVVEGKRGDEDATRRDVEESGNNLTRDPDTQTARVTLDLVEALVTSGSESDNPRRVGAPIRRAVDDLLTSVENNGRVLDEAERVRLLGVLDRLCEWYDDGSLDNWRQSANKRIEGLSS